MIDLWAGARGQTAAWIILVVLVGLGFGVVWAFVDHAITVVANWFWPAHNVADADLEILVGYAPRSFASKAAKQFRSNARTDHRATIVDLQERRRAR